MAVSLFIEDRVFSFVIFVGFFVGFQRRGMEFFKCFHCFLQQKALIINIFSVPREAFCKLLNKIKITI